MVVGTQTQRGASWSPGSGLFMCQSTRTKALGSLHLSNQKRVFFLHSQLFIFYLVINTPTHCSAHCFGGSPAAFRHKAHPEFGQIMRSTCPRKSQLRSRCGVTHVKKHKILQENPGKPSLWQLCRCVESFKISLFFIQKTSRVTTENEGTYCFSLVVCLRIHCFNFAFSNQWGEQRTPVIKVLTQVFLVFCFFKPCNLECQFTYWGLEEHNFQ